MRIDWRVAILAAGLACGSADTRRIADQPDARSDAASNGLRVCPRPTRGIVVGHDTVAGFSTHATLGALRQQCRMGDSALYDAVGWQAVAWTFPFVGGSVMAVQSKHSYGETVHDDEVPDLWIAEGDSVRLPDGELMPRTLGALRTRYGFALVDDNVDGDDIDGPHARSCRFPYPLFALAVGDTARHVPDSARVTRVDMDTPGVDTVIARVCLAHQPP